MSIIKEMNLEELYNSLNPNEKFYFPDLREEDRSFLISIINEAMQEAKSQVFFSDQVENKRSRHIVVLIKLVSIFLSERVSIDGVPVTVHLKNK